MICEPVHDTLKKTTVHALFWSPPFFARSTLIQTHTLFAAGEISSRGAACVIHASILSSKASARSEPTTSSAPSPQRATTALRSPEGMPSAWRGRGGVGGVKKGGLWGKVTGWGYGGGLRGGVRGWGYRVGLGRGRVLGKGGGVGVRVGVRWPLAPLLRQIQAAARILRLRPPASTRSPKPQRPNRRSAQTGSARRA